MCRIKNVLSTRMFLQYEVRAAKVKQEIFSGAEMSGPIITYVSCDFMDYCKST